MAEEEDKHSRYFNKLSAEDKQIADAIMSYLNGMNTERANEILHAVGYEVTMHSTIVYS